MGIRNVLVILIVLMLLAGCNQYNVDGEVVYSLDEALVIAHNNSGYMYDSRSSEYDFEHLYEQSDAAITPAESYQHDLEHLWEQAEGDDKEIIEKELLALSLKLFNFYKQEHWDRTLQDLRRSLDHLRQQATSEEVKTKAVIKYSELVEFLRECERQEQKEEEEKRDEWERKEGERLEAVRAEFEKSRQFLSRATNGTLKDKSAQEVKKLMDEWSSQRQLRSPRSEYYSEKVIAMEDALLCEYFSKQAFYKIFGKPVRQQFISSNGLFRGDSYIFYYNCKDGTAQIQVSASDLDDDGIVIIKELNIF